MRALLLAAALAAAAAPPRAVDEVQVIGPPGPALWRITRGGGELWVLPAPPALPRGLAWNRLRLEGVFRGARVLITPSAYRLVRRGRSPVAAQGPLAARLPASVRDRFAAAIADLGESPARFGGLTPLDAAYRLRDDAWRAGGLDPDLPDAAVRAMARSAGATVRPAATYVVTIDAAAPFLSDHEAAGCVDAAVTDAAWARERATFAARAWALGDVRAWLAQSQPAGVARCLDASPAFAALRTRNLDDVAAAASAALATGGRAVLLTSPDLLLRPDGLLDRLRDAGARIEAPAAAAR